MANVESLLKEAKEKYGLEFTKGVTKAGIKEAMNKAEQAKVEEGSTPSNSEETAPVAGGDEPKTAPELDENGGDESQNTSDGVDEGSTPAPSEESAPAEPTPTEPAEPEKTPKEVEDEKKKAEAIEAAQKKEEEEAQAAIEEQKRLEEEAKNPPKKSEGSEIASAIREGLKEGKEDKRIKITADKSVKSMFSVVKNKQTGEVMIRENSTGVLSKVQLKSLEEKEADLQKQEVEEL